MARATRRLVLSRDNHRCTECGESQNLEVHHVVPRRLGGPDEPSNLVTLCSACHFRLHVTSQTQLGELPTAHGTEQTHLEDGNPSTRDIRRIADPYGDYPKG